MNRKRKYQLNQSQEYQLQYLSAKEESFPAELPSSQSLFLPLF